MSELRPCPFCGKKPKETNLDFEPSNLNIQRFVYSGDCCGALCAKVSLEHWNSFWCWKEIDRLKKAAEKEFQRAEGKEEMKKWFQVKIVELEAKNEEMRKEIEKQCLLLGKSGSREADLLAEIDLLKKELCRVYSSDGSFVELRMPEEAIRRQIGAAQEADRLKAQNEKMREALKEISQKVRLMIPEQSPYQGLSVIAEKALQDGGES